MNLLCDLGWHRPAGLPRWNDGYYFSRCGRCGQDLVRTAYQKWHVPRGYRIVWCPEPPAARADIAVHPASEHETPRLPGSGEMDWAASREPEASPAPAPAAEVPLPDCEAATAEESFEPLPAAPAAAEKAFSAGADPTGPARGRLPISEVLDHLKAEEGARDLPPAPASRQPPSASQRAPVAWSDDFMKDDPGDELIIGARADRPAEGPAASGPVGAFPWEEEQGLLPARLFRRARQTVGNFADRVRRREERPPRPASVIGAALAISAAIAFAVIVISPASAPLADPAQNPPEARSDRSVPEAGSQLPVSAPRPLLPEAKQSRAAGIVIAGVLSCRSAPSLRAARIRNLLGGQEVEIVARAGDWLALAERNGQCWAEARFVSARLTGGG
jgi:hypothetical protein